VSSVQKRERILEGAERVFRAKGLTGATTREIAREVGCADGTLYVHFDDRLALFLAVLERTLPGFLIPLRALEDRVGQRTVRANLEEVLHGALTFQNEIMPLLGGLLADPKLLMGYRAALRRRNLGPHRSLAAIEEYIGAEQKLGRVPKRVQARAVAFTLLGACFYRTFLKHFLGDALSPDERVFVRGVVSSLRLRVTSTPKLSTRENPRPATTPDSGAI
jgi:AcrR family transcriptional regulator